MSELTKRAQRILEGSIDGGRAQTRPHDYDLRIAETYAAIAQAEALERIAAALEPKRTTVTPADLGIVAS